MRALCWTGSSFFALGSTTAYANAPVVLLAEQHPSTKLWPWLLLLGIIIIAIVVTLIALVTQIRRNRRAMKATPQRIPLSIVSSHTVDKMSISARHTPQTSFASSQSGEMAVVTGEHVSPYLEHGFELDIHGQTHPDTRLRDHLDTSVVSMSCPECSQLYEVGTLFCPYDGQQLHRMEDDPSLLSEEEAEMICPVCSTEHEPGQWFCVHDQARLVPKDPATGAFVPAPIMFCPTCHDEYAPDKRRCPEDETALLPMSGRRTCGLPASGVGPKRRICPDCGHRYPIEAQFCAFDRARLMNIN